MQGLRFDHAIIAVTDLESTINDFQRLGFTVRYGGEHGDGKTKNALIVFSDGSYLELLAPTNRDFMDTMETVDLSHFLDFVAQGDGWAGFALNVQDLQEAARRMKHQGLHPSALTPGSRMRPDGQMLSWRSVSVDNSRTPFFIEDQTERSLRVPADSAITHHSNGVTGVEAIIIAVPKLERAVEHFEALLDLQATQPGPEIQSAQTAAFSLGDTVLILAAPEKFGSPFSAYIEERGEVPYEIRLRTNRADQAGPLNYRKVHKARIQLVH